MWSFNKMSVTILTFVIGVFSVWFWLYPENQNETVSIPTEQSQPTNSSVEIKSKEIESEPQKFIVETDIADDFYYNTEIKNTLENLVAYKSISNRNTFYVSPIQHENIDFVWAYWKEDKSIIILHLPISQNEDIEWLYYKYRIDLIKEVVPKELGNMGCCLVSKAWADGVLAKCRAGTKLKIMGKKKANK